MGKYRSKAPEEPNTSHEESVDDFSNILPFVLDFFNEFYRIDGQLPVRQTTVAGVSHATATPATHCAVPDTLDQDPHLESEWFLQHG